MLIIRDDWYRELKKKKDIGSYLMLNMNKCISYYDTTDKLEYNNLTLNGVVNILLRDKEFGCLSYDNGKVVIKGKTLSGIYMRHTDTIWYYIGTNFVLCWSYGIVYYLSLNCNDIVAYDNAPDFFYLVCSDKTISFNEFNTRVIVRGNRGPELYDMIAYKDLDLDIFLSSGEKIGFLAKIEKEKK